MAYFMRKLTGLALLVLGVLLKTKPEIYQDFLAGNFHAPPILLIVIGCIIFVVAFLGCCVAIRESHCMVITFTIFLLTICILGIVACTLMYSNDTQDVLDDGLKNLMTKYYTDEQAKKSVDTIQETLKCCGYKGPQDYLPKKIPKSCSSESGSKIYYTTGCSDALKQFVTDSGIVLGGVAIAFAFIEVVRIVYLLCLGRL